MENRSQSSSKRLRSRTGWLVLTTVVVVAVGVTAWTRLRSSPESNDPDVLVNLTSMVGKEAPSFMLNDSEGQSLTVSPGDGRKYLLIFHMGSI
jgi:hypothetical protein